MVGKREKNCVFEGMISSNGLIKKENQLTDLSMGKE